MDDLQIARRLVRAGGFALCQSKRRKTEQDYCDRSSRLSFHEVASHYRLLNVFGVRFQVSGDKGSTFIPAISSSVRAFITVTCESIR